MLLKLSSLLSSINNKIVKSERNYIYYLLKLAGYEDKFRKMIEDESKNNPKDFNYLFNGSDRLYLPFSGNAEESQELSQNDKYVIYVIGRLGYKADKADYIKGYCYDDKNLSRPIRIGKLLTKVLSQCESALSYIAQATNIDLNDKDFRRKLNLSDESIDSYKKSLEESEQNTSNPSEDLLVKSILEHKVNFYSRLRDDVIKALEKFKSSELRGGEHEDLILVISQNPHDIAKASYERAWDSCWNIESGMRSDCAINEARSGGLIAYLIKKDDQNIERPLSRLLIRKFKNDNGEILAKAEDVVFGLDIGGFKDAVKKFVDANIISSKSPGMYKLQGGKYSDSFDQNLIIHPPADKISSEYVASLIKRSIEFTIDNFLAMEIKASTVEDLHAKSIANYGHEWAFHKMFQHPAIDNLAATTDDDDLIRLFFEYFMPRSNYTHEYAYTTFKELVKVSPDEFRQFLIKKIRIENLMASDDLLSRLSSKHASIMANDWQLFLSPSIVVNFERHRENEISEIASNILGVNKELINMRLKQMQTRGFSATSYAISFEDSLNKELDRYLPIYQDIIGYNAAKKVIMRLNKQIAWRLSHLDNDISDAIVIFYIQNGDINLDGRGLDD